MATTTLRTSPARLRKSVLEILPAQGEWSDAWYLTLTDCTNRLIEFTDGFVEELPRPTDAHQTILLFLLGALQTFLKPMNGKVLIAPLRLRIREGKFREPDLLLVRSASDPRRQNRFWTGADLVLEVVSPDGSRRDLVEKRRDYAEGGVPEYWIVNPLTEKITVLVLSGKKYRRFGVFGRGKAGRSSTLDGFEINVDEVFDAQ
jgi:Uma2 family endonuclease